MPRLFLPRRLDQAWPRLGVAGDPLRTLLALQGNPTYISWWDDFLGAPTGTWPANAHWSYPADIGTGTQVVGITAAVGGTLTLTTDASGTGSAGQAVGLNWSGDGWAYFVARAQLNTLALSKFEIGITDAVGDDGAVAVKATPTWTADNAALFCRDTTEDTAVTFMSVNATVASANTDWTGTFANGTYYIFEVVVGGPTSTTGDNCAGYINGALVASGAITGSAPLTPWFYVEELSASARTLTVDWAACIGRRP